MSVKRYNIYAKPWDYRSADLEVEESVRGDWVESSEVERLERIEAAAKAVLEAHDSDNLRDWLTRCDEARQALRAALEGKPDAS